MKTLTNPIKKIGNNKLILYVCLGVVVAVFVGLFLAIDILARQKFEVVNNEMERVRQDVMKPAGAIERTGGDYFPYMRGNGFIGELGCFDVNCPVIHRTWFVPIAQNEEINFIKAAMNAGGYQLVSESLRNCPQLDNGSLCEVSGSKNKLLTRISVNDVGSVAPPSANVTPKKWRLVNVAIDYN